MLRQGIPHYNFEQVGMMDDVKIITKSKDDSDVVYDHESKSSRTLRKLSDPNMYSKDTSNKVQTAQVAKLKKKRRLSYDPTHSRKNSFGENQSRYKTELCRSFIETGKCKYGPRCQFAHGGDELKVVNRHPKYKTEICRTFHTIGYCPYGVRCRFVHISLDEKLLHTPFLLPDQIPEPFDIPKMFLEDEISELLSRVELNGPVFRTLPVLEKLRNGNVE